MTNPQTPNFNPGVGRLATDRFDFQNHVDGYDFKHDAADVILDPPVTISDPESNVRDAIIALKDALTVPVVPDATSLTKGVIKLSGDLAGTAGSVLVTGLRGFPIANIVPTSGTVLTWNGTAWTPTTVSSAFTLNGDVTGSAASSTVIKLNGKPIASTNPSSDNTLIWNGSSWIPQTMTATKVNYSGGGNWTDGTTNPATTVESQLDKIISDLSATTGDVKIGAPTRTASPVSLSSGSVGTQIAALLAALNSFENQKAAVSGLASLNGSTKLTEAQRGGWIVSTDGYVSTSTSGLGFDNTNSTSYVDIDEGTSTIKVTFTSICNNNDIILVQAHLRGYRTNDLSSGAYYRVALIEAAQPAVTIGYEEILQYAGVAQGDTNVPGIMIHLIGRAVLSNVGTGGTATVKLQFKSNNASYAAYALGPAFITATLIRP